MQTSEAVQEELRLWNYWSVVAPELVAGFILSPEADAVLLDWVCDWDSPLYQTPSSPFSTIPASTLGYSSTGTDPAQLGTGSGFWSSPVGASDAIVPAEPITGDIDLDAIFGAGPVEHGVFVPAVELMPAPPPSTIPARPLDRKPVIRKGQDDREGYQEMVVADMAKRRKEREAAAAKQEEARELRERNKTKRASRRVARAPYDVNARAKVGAIDQALLKTAKKGKGTVKGDGFALITFSL